MKSTGGAKAAKRELFSPGCSAQRANRTSEEHAWLAQFRVVTTPAFETEFRKVSRGNALLIGALEDVIATLSEDPHNLSGQHQIKKLAVLQPGEGQWRIRGRDYRVRYDIFGNEVVLHSFRHRKEAY